MIKKKKAKNHMAKLMEESVKIKCCYCLIKDDCEYRARKEDSEAKGFITYCNMTPNRPKSARKNKKKD